jgi:hypothetical protein
MTIRQTLKVPEVVMLTHQKIRPGPNRLSVGQSQQKPQALRQVQVQVLCQHAELKSNYRHRAALQPISFKLH